MLLFCSCVSSEYLKCAATDLCVHIGITRWANTVCGDASHRTITSAVSCTATRWEDGVSRWSERTHTWSQDKRTQLFQLPATRFLTCRHCSHSFWFCVWLTWILFSSLSSTLNGLFIYVTIIFSCLSLKFKWIKIQLQKHFITKFWQMWIVFNNSFTFAFTEELQKAVVKFSPCLRSVAALPWKIWMFICAALQQS